MKNTKNEEDPSRILNGDETSFSLCPKTGNVVAPKYYKNIYLASASENDTITVLVVISANRTIFSLMVIFPYLRPPKDVVNIIPDTWFLDRTESGCMMGVDGFVIFNKNLRFSLIQFCFLTKYIWSSLDLWCLVISKKKTFNKKN